MNDNKKIETHRVSIAIPTGMLLFLESQFPFIESPSKLVLLGLLEWMKEVNRSQIKPSITEGDE